MIRFTLEGVEYGLQFRHTEATVSELGLPGITPDESRRVTHATILDAKTMAPVHQGISICHPYDVFVKDEGRRRALADALPYGSLAKPFRTAVWNAYFAR
jgi:hypothetical protein